ncbi:hypothetical protein FK220_011865 [Flavobacteriaceae bacterium TP-CH-4]|uniref:Outer membrane protein beta-barrel domain-containing protein n=1 Tax=Pelagihabitans pacificus TaxID=2696054 RepID=A0A967AVV5_9FLAO|nr:hypothetical protein [Pelagihabitans pacificus]NHF60043.1 hypothetical protein [Pelagihabitans pacificus]
MKIVKTVTLLFFFGTMAMNAQEISNHALGLRLGDSDGFGAEISYQKQIKRTNRLELDLGWRDSRNYDAFKLAGLYQWVLPIDGGFNWYYGFGGGLGSVDFEPRFRDDEPFDPDGGLFIFAAGDIGIEYNFDFPLLLSLDFRPEIGLIGYNDFSDNFDFDIALGVRYQF